MKKAGVGRAKSRYSKDGVEPGGFFLANAPIPPCWDSGKLSENKCSTNSEKGIDTTDFCQVQKSHAEGWLNSYGKTALTANIPIDGNRLSEGSVQCEVETSQFQFPTTENAENRQPLNPEAELELANNGANVQGLECIAKQGKGAERKSENAEEDGASDMRCIVSTKLLFDPKLTQAKRRENILNWQRKRRDELIEKVRHLENDSWSEDEADEMMDFVKIQEERKKGNKKWSGRFHTNPTNRRWYNHARVMLSEWMGDKPEDFDENWLGVMCPVGMRCLVVASRGKTRIVTRRGFLIGEFQSCLPAGRKYQKHQGSMGAPGKGVTILDCIWSEESQTFYILDLLCWNSMLYTDYDTEFRLFFINSKIEEVPEILEKTTQNPFPFCPLKFFAAEELPNVMSTCSPPFPEQVDGVLFFHKKTFYIYESTNPLCLWIYLSKIPETLSVDVSPELLDKELKTRVSKPREVKPENVDMDVIG